MIEFTIALREALMSRIVSLDISFLPSNASRSWIDLDSLCQWFWRSFHSMLALGYLRSRPCFTIEWMASSSKSSVNLMLSAPLLWNTSSEFSCFPKKNLTGDLWVALHSFASCPVSWWWGRGRCILQLQNPERFLLLQGQAQVWRRLPPEQVEWYWEISSGILKIRALL